MSRCELVCMVESFSSLRSVAELGTSSDFVCAASDKRPGRLTESKVEAAVLVIYILHRELHGPL